MIARIWHGWTTHENAPAYQKLLNTEVFPSIEKKNIKGYRMISLLKRELDEEVEFITIMMFDNLTAVKAFVGDDYEASYVPEKAKKVLSRHDERSQHYEVADELLYA